MSAEDDEPTTASLDYGNWIRTRILWRLGVGTFAAALLALAPVPPLLRVAAGAVALILLVSLSLPLYAHYCFSARGGNLQRRIYALITETLGARTGGEILDIGAGNGVLAVTLATANKSARVVGIDNWGSDWEYAQSVCEDNARRAGVEDRVSFQQGTAAALPYADATFAAVASNLTFHEVKSEPQKGRLVSEALRILRPGGRFAFVDLFYDGSYYGSPREFETYIKTLAVSRIELCPLSAKIALPKLLQHPRILGRAGLLHGEK